MSCRQGLEDTRSRVGAGNRCGKEGRLSLRRCCCLESLRLPSPSQQMAQELVWGGGGLRLPDPLSLSPPAVHSSCHSSCPGSSWSPDWRQLLLRVDLSCPVALASLGWGPETLVPQWLLHWFLASPTPCSWEEEVLSSNLSLVSHVGSGLASIPSLWSFLLRGEGVWQRVIGKGKGRDDSSGEHLEASKGRRNLWHS